MDEAMQATATMMRTMNTLSPAIAAAADMAAIMAAATTAAGTRLQLRFDSARALDEHAPNLRLQSNP